MRTRTYLCNLIAKLSSRDDVMWDAYPLHYQVWTFDLLRIQSKNITTEDKIIFLTAWMHGEEIWGPLSLLSFIHKIIDLIHSRGYKFIMYPLMNPSWFDQGKRFNGDDDEWPYGNNDFVRYEMIDGSFADECMEGQIFAKRYRSSDPKLQQKLPLETILLHKLLRKDPLEQVVAHLDLHQDYITPIDWAYTYFYAFQDVYQPIVNNIKKYIKLLANIMIGAGQTWAARSNKHGCIMRHDGTINDLFYRLGMYNTVTVETTGKTPLVLAKKINRIWIKWMILLLNQMVHTKIHQYS